MYPQLNMFWSKLKTICKDREENTNMYFYILTPFLEKKLLMCAEKPVKPSESPSKLLLKKGEFGVNLQLRT